MIKLLKNIKSSIRKILFAKSQRRKIKKKNSLIHSFYNNKTIFIHIPKTAGISIIKSIYGNVTNEGHRSIYFYKQVFEKNFNDFFTFSFVRNPYDRLYSSYKFLENGGMNEYDKIAFQKYLSKFSDFEDFVLNGLNNKIIYEIIHFVPQSEFICDKNGKIMVDFVGRFENLNNDLNSISIKTNKEFTLGHHNKNFKKKYRKIYNNDMKIKVYEVYKRDFVVFNYNFSNNNA